MSGRRTIYRPSGADAAARTGPPAGRAAPVGVAFDVGGTVWTEDGGRFEEVGAWAAAKRLHAGGLLPADRLDAFAARVLRLRRLPREGADGLQTHPTRAALRGAAGAFGLAPSDGEIDELEDAFYGPQVAAATAPPGMTELLRDLAGRARLAAVSNTRSHALIEAVLERLGVRELFEPLVTSASVGVRKPRSRPLREVVERWRIEPSRVIVVGDDPASDAVPARALGMRTVLLRFPGAAGGEAGAGVADVVVADVAGLRAALDRLLAEVAQAPDGPDGGAEAEGGPRPTGGG